MALTKIKTGSISDSVTLTSPDINTPDIDGGTADGLVIGGATPAAGSFTNVTVSGTVDGRDVAADGTKLDGIEAAADVTDATNVTAAGALMDSELTAIASVKALNQGVATGDSPSFAGVSVDYLNLNGYTISSTSDILLDSDYDIILDADGADIILKDGGVTFAELDKDGDNLRIKNPISDGDIKIQGSDAGSIITALSLDMSAAGAATFNSTITLKDTLSISSTSTSGFLQASSNVLQFGTSSDDRVDFYANNAVALSLAGTGAATFNSRVAATGTANSSSASHVPAFLGSGSYGGGIATRDGSESGWYQQSSGADWHFYHNRTVASDTPESKKVLSFNSSGAATFNDDVAADAFLPTTSGAYGSNHVGAHVGGITVNAATGQTGYIMSAGSAAVTFAPTGATIQLGGLTTANKLDDYEEGTWTPAIVAYTGTNPTVNAAGSTSGFYTKIGNLVTVSFNLDLITVTGVTGGIMKISGLPFTPNGDAGGSYTGNQLTLQRPDTSAVLVLADGFGILSQNNGGNWAWEFNSIFDGSSNLRSTVSYKTNS